MHIKIRYNIFDREKARERGEAELSLQRIK